MPEANINEFAPNPTQKGFIESRAAADLFCSRIGEGKSTALSWSCFVHTRLNPGAEWVFIRDTFENIRRSTMKTFFEWFPPGIYGEYKISEKRFVWAEGVGKGSVTFIGMDDPSDASKLLSWELGGFAIDEPAPAAGSLGVDEQIFDLAMTRLRQPGMNWYASKLATNNPDEDHWTYKKFVGAEKIEGYEYWQPTKPENMDHLPEGYYDRIRQQLAHRPDLIRRFIEGEFGFQQEGKSVTPQWNDRIHLSLGLSPIKGRELVLCWDFGLNPTCIITQVTPQGYWNVLQSWVGDGIGVEELIENLVLPELVRRYKGCPIRHVGDPAGNQRDQSSSKRTAVKSIKRMIGGTFKGGPVRWWERINPLQALLARTVNGLGIIQVDRTRAREVWHALRGGWHYHVARTGVVSGEAKKDINSHPGDALSYGAAVLFPTGQFVTRPSGLLVPEKPMRAFGGQPGWRIGPDGSGPLPVDGSPLKS